jgi:hypothetical protein
MGCWGCCCWSGPKGLHRLQVAIPEPVAQKRISAAELRQHLGADARELAALRLLFGGDLFPQADAAVALQHCAGIGPLLRQQLQHRHPARRSAMACSSNCGLRASSTASLRGWPVAEGKRERQTLLTIPLTRGELRVVKVNATARGYTMAGWVRELLRAEMVDLLP